MRRYHSVLAAVLLLFAGSLAARADGVGTSVTGTLRFQGNPLNYFDPANGFVPAGYENTAGTTVTISNTAVEFGYNDGANFDTADFTGTGLTVTDVVGTLGALPFVMTFTDPIFASFTQLTGLPAGFTSSFSGDTLTVDFAGTTTPGTYAATFSYATTPEPSSLLLLGTGLVSAAGLMRRRWFA